MFYFPHGRVDDVVLTNTTGNKKQHYNILQWWTAYLAHFPSVISIILPPSYMIKEVIKLGIRLSTGLRDQTERHEVSPSATSHYTNFSTKLFLMAKTEVGRPFNGL